VSDSNAQVLSIRDKAREKRSRNECRDKYLEVVREEALTNVVFGMKVRMHFESPRNGIESYRQPFFGCDLFEV